MYFREREQIKKEIWRKKTDKDIDKETLINRQRGKHK